MEKKYISYINKIRAEEDSPFVIVVAPRGAGGKGAFMRGDMIQWGKSEVLSEEMRF